MIIDAELHEFEQSIFIGVTVGGSLVLLFSMPELSLKTR
jgi:hypothetical protein